MRKLNLGLGLRQALLRQSNLARDLPTVGYLALRNRFSLASVVGENQVDVSLTTYGHRLRSAYLAIESIGRGSAKPGRLILWLDNSESANRLPKSLRRLQRRGLEVRFCEDFKSHKKYYPYVERQLTFSRPLVISDDDVVHRRHWLRDLERSYRSHPAVVHCYRARRFRFNGARPSRYLSWHLVGDTTPNFANLPTGVGGVLYPPALLSDIRDAGRGFVRDAPGADDVWLHALAVRSGFRTRQIVRRAPRERFIPRSQETTLGAINVWDGGNDAQILNCYTPGLFDTIQVDLAESG